MTASLLPLAVKRFSKRGCILANTVAHTYNPSMQWAGAGKLGFHAYSRLHREFKASLVHRHSKNLSQKQEKFIQPQILEMFAHYRKIK